MYQTTEELAETMANHLPMTKEEALCVIKHIRRRDYVFEWIKQEVKIKEKVLVDK
jgi:hypothetical protein